MQPEIPIDPPTASEPVDATNTTAADLADHPNPALTNNPNSEEVDLNIPDINKELVLLTFQGMAHYAEAYQQLLQLYHEQPTVPLFNRLQNAILDASPSILSAHIRDLFTPEAQQYGRLRLKEINEVYFTLGILLAAIALANLGVPELTSAPAITEKERETLRGFLEMPTTAADRFDHLHLAATISNILQRNGVTPYVQELADFNRWFRPDNEYYSAYVFLETEIRQRLQADDIRSREVEALCLKGGYHLGQLLQACAFLCTYQMVTVKDLSVYHPKSSPEPVFVHTRAILKGRDFAKIDREPLQDQLYTSNNSIFITRNTSDGNPALNLSPFIIDENAFRRQKDFLPKIYFYHGMAEEKLNYQHAEILSYNFRLSPQYDPGKYRDLDIIFQQMTFFRRLLDI